MLNQCANHSFKVHSNNRKTRDSKSLKDFSSEQSCSSNALNKPVRNFYGDSQNCHEFSDLTCHEDRTSSNVLQRNMAENIVASEKKIPEACPVHPNSLSTGFTRPTEQPFCNNVGGHFKSDLERILQKNGLVSRPQKNFKKLIKETTFLADNDKATSCIDLRNVYCVSKPNQYSIVSRINENSKEKSNVKPRATEMLHMNSFNSADSSLSKHTKFLPPANSSHFKTPDAKSLETSFETFHQISNSSCAIENRNALPLCQTNMHLPKKRGRPKGKIRKAFPRTKKRKLKRGFAVRKTQYRKEIHQVIHCQARKNSALLAKNLSYKPKATRFNRKIPDNFYSALFTMLFCCFPLGVASMIYCCKVRAYLAVSNREKAQQSSLIGRKLAQTGVMMGVTTLAYLFVYYVIKSNIPYAVEYDYYLPEYGVG